MTYQEATMIELYFSSENSLIPPLIFTEGSKSKKFGLNLAFEALYCSSETKQRI